MNDRICSIEGCDRPHRARGWCTMHYFRARRTGDPLTQPTRPPLGDRAEAIKARTRPSGDCLIWTGRTDRGGYGHLGKSPAHRAAWEIANGPVPGGMMIDHACRNRACVRVEHLRLATRSENARNLKGARATNKSTGLRNISPNHGGFAVGIRKDHVRYSKTFRTLEDAVEHANAMRAELFGEFAGAPTRLPKEKS